MTATAERIMVRAPVAMQDGKVTVDEAAGVIRNCALLTAGEAHPCNAPAFIVDRQTLADAVRLVNASGGLRSRLTHPEVDGEERAARRGCGAR